jgi:hypothetical protein
LLDPITTVVVVRHIPIFLSLGNYWFADADERGALRRSQRLSTPT